ncbi:hypothetical protein B0I35DRAFT_461753 [Stachybotrys elegans]|uniref:Uncharacterized protein n=1 Tax=Stachybotrys elegans TaxID=80388 RepID=A0A8K0SKR9_9HYPO|nr:hypothetical protein B0I35DRAFT_461753 [Stachybotrys elegans]
MMVWTWKRIRNDKLIVDPRQWFLQENWEYIHTFMLQASIGAFMPRPISAFAISVRYTFVMGRQTIGASLMYPGWEGAEALEALSHSIENTRYEPAESAGMASDGRDETVVRDPGAWKSRCNPCGKQAREGMQCKYLDEDQSCIVLQRLPEKRACSLPSIMVMAGEHLARGYVTDWMWDKEKGKYYIRPQ